MIVKLKDGQNARIRVVKDGDMYEYFVKDIKIGVYDPKVMEDNILILQNTLNNELSGQIKDQINSISKEEIVKEAELNGKIENYAEELGAERIKDILVLDLKEDENKDKTIDKNKNTKDDKSIVDKNKEAPRTTTKDVDVKQEISLTERANDMHDLKRWLGANIPPEYTKMAVIESSQMSQMKDENGQSYKNNSTRYSLALVDKDNNIVPLQKYIPNLKQRDAAGNNPMTLKYQVDKDGNVERDSVLSEYEIGNKILQIDNKEMGRIEVNIGKEEHGGNETIGVQMRDSNSTFATDIETRQVIGEYESNGQYTVDKNLEEAKQHSNCDKMTREDIDGDPNTKSHDHTEQVDFDDLAIEWGFYKDGKPDAEKAKEYLEKEMRENPDKTVEENIDDLTDEFNDDFGGRGSRI